MKKIIVLFSLIVSGIVLFGQDSVMKDTAWKMGGQFVFTFSQSTFSDWAAGGDNAYSGNGRAGLFANYAKNKVSWENNLDLAYGKTNTKGLGLRKTDDLIELNSKFGFKASKKWNYAVVFNGKTQFDKGYKYPDDKTLPRVPTSEFMSPLYLNLAFGADNRPNKFTSIFLSPVNIKNVSVRDIYYSERYSIDSAKKSRTDLGAIVKFKYEKEIITNLNFLTKLDVFADYLHFEEITDIDVNWEVLLTLKVFKVITVNLNTNLLWDSDVLPVLDDGTLGDEAKIQYKQIFGAGLTYKF